METKVRMILTRRHAWDFIEIGLQKVMDFLEWFGQVGKFLINFIF